MYGADLRFESGAAAPSDPLASIRARGRVRVEAKQIGSRTVRGAVYESGGLRVRFPREHSGMLDATIVNVAGGMAGGDRFELEFHAASGARLVVSSTAAEKIYRSEREPAQVVSKLSAAAGALCAWLPQETIVYNGARLKRSLDAELDAGAAFVACEMTVLGRTAMGETVNALSWRDRWRIRRGGKLIFADATKLEGDAQQLLARAATGGGAHAFATLIYCGDDAESERDRLRALFEAHAGACEAGVSAFDGMMFARFAAHDAQALRRLVTLCLEGFAGVRLPRGWHT